MSANTASRGSRILQAHLAATIVKRGTGRFQELSGQIRIGTIQALNTVIMVRQFSLTPVAVTRFMGDPERYSLRLWFCFPAFIFN